jgi:hypothetical protein
MTKIEKIEAEIRALSTNELAVLRSWLNEYDAQLWDKEMEADASSGKLDALAEAALRAHQKGKSTEL